MVGRLVGCAALLLLAGCGLDIVGQVDTSDGATTTPPTTMSDGGGGGPDPPTLAPVIATCGAAGAACASALPTGFRPLVLAGESANLCPVDFESLDVVAEPVAGPGACTCGCAIDPSDPPTCSRGSFVPQVGPSSCSGASNITYTVNGPGCTAVSTPGSLTIVAYSQILLFPLSPGKCTTSAAADLTKVASKPFRLCKPTPACVEDVCLGNVPPTFAACVVHDGDVPCPSTPSIFTKRMIVGAKATLACAGCTACANKGTCEPGLFRYYSDSSCANEVATRTVDGQCHPLKTGTVTGFSRFRYEVPVVQPGCDATSTPTSSVGVDPQLTVCCR